MNFAKIKNKVRKLKAFTLAEILIVLMVIGTVAAITLPQLAGGVDDAQYKASLQKAYTSLSQIVAAQSADNNMPTAGKDVQALKDFFQALTLNINTEGFAAAPTAETINNGTRLTGTDIKEAVTYAGSTFGDSDGDTLEGAATAVANTWTPWIIAADGTAFSVMTNNADTCTRKGGINKATATQANAFTNACLIMVIDVNGLRKGPNKIESQVITSTTKLAKLTGDRYYLYIAQNGIAKGSSANTVTGRLLANEK